MEKDEYLKHSIDSDNNPIDDMVFDDPNPEEAGKEDGIEVYKKVLVDLASKISIAMPQTFMLGDFLESLILRQDRAVEILQNL